MNVKSVAWLGLMGVSTVATLQEASVAATQSNERTAIECDSVAQWEGVLDERLHCAISRQESATDFELIELVRSVEFSTRKKQAQMKVAQASKPFHRKGLVAPRPDSLAYLVEGTKDI